MEFFGIGYQELTLILIAALVVFGPAKLPEVAGQAAKFLRDARKMVTDLTGDFESNAGIKEFKTAIEGELAGVKKELEGAGISVRNDLQGAANTVNSTVKSAAAAASAKPTTKKMATTTPTAKTTTTTSVTTAKPKASKKDPYAGLVALPEVAPKSVKAVAAPVNNGHSTESIPASGEPSRETSEAVMRARERRASAGYNRKVSAV